MKYLVVAVFAINSFSLFGQTKKLGYQNNVRKEYHSQLFSKEFDEDYYSEQTLSFLFGLATNNKWNFFYYPKLLNNLGILNINYQHSNFYKNINVVTPQVGLLNAFGVNLISLYYKLGVDIRFRKNISIIANVGLLLGAERSYYYFGPGVFAESCINYYHNIGNNLMIASGLGLQIMLFEKSSLNYYATIGLRKIL